MAKKTAFGSELAEAMAEALAHASGAPIKDTHVHVVDADRIDPKAIRTHLNLTQEQMARFLGTSVSGYRKWEQGQRQPSGAARTLLRVMEQEPEAVLRVLRAA
ncbi:helix-turn-helix domain-containing protein [Shinella yambaruensis]|uniref:HTH cro/C1-type domain-containing protein n=1 Tax=Shinella yambaruensis TaxID=415996 RepID=A0ABQ5ZR09_9HYPH|nr:MULTISPECIES: helix-turn-helix domain-containing protein [Shinella]CAI0336458.1 Transcriptional regulator [Rhizobiaceae bacterium]CAK7254995.1 putative transcriptional regulator [Shinella sp. WSC3-e]MCJ8026377.1 helix-turn-helix domain-containing protein [Shinella yambaruensis]MCO5136512.1 helix-turn-helix domain-containing protein [Shinella sp.]MCU7981784.1 helix-turn-helix domain-containing protein [Shinella yambaruensis]